MQMDANDRPDKVEAITDYGGAEAPLVEKNTALKLLCDYKRQMGWGWTRVRNQIIDVTGAPATETAPILSRQDLEEWEKRNTNLGESKYKWVRMFLLNPKMSNFFSEEKLRFIEPNVRISRILYIVSRYMSSPFEPFVHGIRPTRISLNISKRSHFNHVKRALPGLYARPEENSAEFRKMIYIFKPPLFDILIAHTLSWRTYHRGEIGDWELERSTGIVCYDGKKVVFFLEI